MGFPVESGEKGKHPIGQSFKDRIDPSKFLHEGPIFTNHIVTEKFGPDVGRKVMQICHYSICLSSVHIRHS